MSVRAYVTHGDGARIGRPFREVAGILAGNPRQDPVTSEIERMGGLFGAES
jgi:hypothetical protein